MWLFFFLIVLPLLFVAFTAAVLVGFAYVILWVAKAAYQTWDAKHSGEYLDGEELDGRDPIDRAILAGREAQRREDLLKLDVERRAWR